MSRIIREGQGIIVFFGGRQKYESQGDSIPYDAEIVITYHAKRGSTIPFTERSLRKLNYVDVEDKLQELGLWSIFIAIG